MRKTTLLLSMIVMAAMILTACGGGATSTNVAPTQLPVTSVATEAPTATEAPPATEAATETPGVPITGAAGAARMSNELDFQVLDQTGAQVGKVSDMVLDFSNNNIAYVIVDSGGFLGVGAKKVAVPWNLLTVQTGSGTGTGTATSAPTTGGSGTATEAPTTGGSGTATEAPTMSGSALSTATPLGVATGQAGTGSSAGTDTGTATSAPTLGTATEAPTTGGSGTGTSSMTGQQVFILQTDQNTLKNAPAFNPSSLPPMGQPAGNWDAAIQSYWQGAGSSGTGSNTPAPVGTAVTDMTPTTVGGTGTTGTATSVPTMGTATSAPTTGGSGTGTGSSVGAMALQGVALASKVIGAKVTLAQGAGAGTGSGAGLSSTSTPSAGNSSGTGTTGTATSAPTMGTATSAPMTGGSGMSANVKATIDDFIDSTSTGTVTYAVVKATFSDGEHLIPVPLSMLQWDASTRSFVLNADASMLQSAPSFQNGEFPDMSTSGWDSQFNSFWQSNGASGGSGSGSGSGSATETPTP